MNQEDIEELAKDIRAYIEEFIDLSDFKLLYRQVYSIRLSKHGHIWFYDDKQKGTYNVPLTGGISELIDYLREQAKIENVWGANFFSLDENEKFPYDHYADLVEKRERDKSALYYSEEFDHHFQVCYRFFDYFPEPPKRLGFYLLNADRVDEVDESEEGLCEE